MLTQMIFLAKKFFSRVGVREEKAQGLVEYALIIVLIAIVVIGALTLLGPQISNVFNRITDELANAIAK